MLVTEGWTQEQKKEQTMLIFASPKGLSIQYPQQWILLTEDNAEEFVRRSEILLKSNNIKLQDLNWSTLDAVILDPTPDDFTENVNIIIVPQSPGQVNETAKNQVMAATLAQFQTAGITISKMIGNIETFGQYPVISMHYEMIFPGTDIQVAGWQVVLPSETSTYTITCTSGTSNTQEYVPIFTNMLKSIQILESKKEKEAEQALFNTCQENLSGCSRYLQQYPNGTFAADAKSIIKTKSAEETQEKLNKALEDIEKSQARQNHKLAIAARPWWEELIGNKYVQLFAILFILFGQLESNKDFKEATRSRKAVMVLSYLAVAIGIWWGINSLHKHFLGKNPNDGYTSTVTWE